MKKSLKDLSFKNLILIIPAFFLLGGFVFAQKKLGVDGQLSLETGTISGATVKIEKSGRSAGSATVSSSGAFELELDFNSDYTITVTQNGYISRKFRVNTTVPAEAVNDGLNAISLPVYLTQSFPGGPDGNQVDATLKFNETLYDFDFDKPEFTSIATQKKKLDPIKAQAASAQKAQEEADAKAKQEALAKREAEYAEAYRKAQEEEERKKKEAELQAKYDDAIKKADMAFGQKNWEFAKQSYTEASTLKPAETYPKTRLSDVEKNLQADNNYKTEIDKADKAFDAKDYAAAKTAYTAASQIKPTETHPKERIKACDAELDKIAKEKEAKAKYDAAIVKGDKLMTSKDYAGAKTAYNEALAAKPGDATAQQKVADADAKIKEDEERKAKEKELNEKYTAAVIKGDAALKNKTYTEARAAYEEALTLKPNETHPKTKIAEIDAAEKAEADRIAKEKENQAKYDALIVEADRLYGETKLTEAKTKYSEALKLKATEAHPKDQITKIDALIAAENQRKADEAAKEAKYTAAMTKGETALKGNKLAEAKTAFTEASGIKPEEALPKQKIAEVDQLIAADEDRKKQEAELQKQFDAEMAAGKTALAEKKFPEAIGAFDKAIALKPNDAEAKLKKKEAEDAQKKQQELLAKEKETQDKYDAAMARADGLFGAKDYAAAKTSYNEAALLKPNETAPKTKIQEIDGILKQEADAKSAQDKLNKDFDAAIKNGDAALAANKFSDARSAYEQAKNLKPNDPVPAQKLSDLGTKEAAFQAEEAKKKADDAAKLAAEEEAARKKAEEDAAKKAAEEEAKRKADEAAKLAAEEEAKRKAEENAKKQAEEQARLAAEEEAARKKAEEDAAKRSAEEEAKRKADEAARLAAEEEAKRKAEEASKKQAEEQARLAAEEEAARKKAEEEAAKRSAEEEAKRKADEAARLAAEEEAKRKAEEASKKQAEEQARLAAEEEAARKKAEEEAAKRSAEEAAKRKADEDARLAAEADARRKAEEASKKQAEEQARLAAEEEAARKKAAEDAAKRQAEDAARLAAEEEANKKALAEAAAQKKANQEEAKRKFAEDEAKRLADAARRKKELENQKKEMPPPPVAKAAPPKKAIYLYAFSYPTSKEFGIINMNDGSGNRIVSESEYKSLYQKYKTQIYSN
ncbi:MAG: hypothetical protein IBJ09_01300 [Bacteroidia bacterium]|nr:hypothetical protein [Bacteroidia bacterium]